MFFSIAPVAFPTKIQPHLEAACFPPLLRLHFQPKSSLGKMLAVQLFINGEKSKKNAKKKLKKST